MPFNWILEEQSKAYMKAPGPYNWTGLNIRVKAAEDEIARQEFLHDLSEQTRREQENWNKEFIEIYRRAKPAFQRIFLSGDARPSLRQVTEKLLGDGGAHLEIGAGFVERATGTRPDETSTKDFISRCPPFKALLVAFCFAQYDRCIRSPKQRSLGKAGRADMFSAAYLPTFPTAKFL